MDRKDRNTGPAAKDRINKQPTSAAQDGAERESDMTGKVRERGEDPSPNDRDRGERSGKEPAAAPDSGRS